MYFGTIEFVSNSKSKNTLVLTYETMSCLSGELTMAFLIACPNCGMRDVYDFRFGGEFTKRPKPDSSAESWNEYFYLKTNQAGEQMEWWYHKFGCRKWFVAKRNTINNEIEETSWASTIEKHPQP